MLFPGLSYSLAYSLETRFVQRPLNINNNGVLCAVRGDDLPRNTRIHYFIDAQQLHCNSNGVLCGLSARALYRVE
jgi:hypothetical protein